MQTAPDFRFASHTAIISDLHLCEAEPVNTRFPLWKKYKTRQFFYDDTLVDFLQYIESRAAGQKVELILNGDIFDFDSVTSLPENPSFRVHWLEKMRGLFPRPERSQYKIRRILDDHEVFMRALGAFVGRGHRVIFVIGNHDLEMHYEGVQEEIRLKLSLTKEQDLHVRFVDWFYLSNRDTLIEHGNQYDPYCTCEDPINPFSQGYNYKTIQLPFGNLACRYLINGMGFFNPHVDSNYIMSIPAYIRFFWKYMIRAQPQLVLTWFFGSMVTLLQSLSDRLNHRIKDPLKIEGRVNDIAARSNAEPRMVREMRELFATSATQNPLLIAKELWLDRALLALLGIFVFVELMVVIRQIFDLSIYEALIWVALAPLLLLLPFFLFYSKSVVSKVSSFKEPDDRILAMTAAITGASRVVYGHTHIARHEVIGAVEHLNSGTWSPAFLDVECTRSVDMKTFVWIEPVGTAQRKATLMSYQGGKPQVVLNPLQFRTAKAAATNS